MKPRRTKRPSIDPTTTESVESVSPPKLAKTSAKPTTTPALVESTSPPKLAKASSSVGKMAPGAVSWETDGDVMSKGLQPLLFRADPNSPVSEHVIGFDIDDTIITPKSGAKFAKGASDWRWLYPCVPDKLRELNSNGIKLLFFTNQAGIEKGKSDANQLKKKFSDVLAELGIPINVYICTGENHFRKPSTCMWDYMVEHHNQKKKPNLAVSMYVGDAAGRLKDWKAGARKDFSCGDRQFAANVGVKFQTPDEFFLGESATSSFVWKSVNPHDIKATGSYQTSYHNSSAETEVVLLCGPPASGKSTFYRRFFEPYNYTHINRDIMTTESKCVKALEETLTEGKSAVVDNTNPSAASRAVFINAAKQAGVKIRCIILDTPMEVAKHLNYVRQNDTQGKVRRVPDVAYNMYKSKYSQPNVSEGFTEVTKVPFAPVFDKYANKTLFYRWQES